MIGKLHNYSVFVNDNSTCVMMTNARDSLYELHGVVTGLVNSHHNIYMTHFMKSCMAL